MSLLVHVIIDVDAIVHQFYPGEYGGTNLLCSLLFQY